MERAELKYQATFQHFASDVKRAHVLNNINIASLNLFQLIRFLLVDRALQLASPDGHWGLQAASGDAHH